VVKNLSIQAIKLV